MREALRDKNRLKHILEQISKLEQAVSDITFEEFDSDSILLAAVSYYTMIIGEASYMLSKDFKDAHPDTPWRQIEGMRHHIVHGYYQVRKDMLWNVVINDLKPLKEQIKKYLDETDWDQWEKNKLSSNP